MRAEVMRECAKEFEEKLQFERAEWQVKQKEREEELFREHRVWHEAATRAKRQAESVITTLRSEKEEMKRQHARQQEEDSRKNLELCNYIFEVEANLMAAREANEDMKFETRWMTKEIKELQQKVHEQDEAWHEADAQDETWFQEVERWATMSDEVQQQAAALS